MSTAPTVSRVWSFCTTLRDDGVSYGDYLEQLTYLIFLKMADEYGKPPYHRDVGIPPAYDWQSLKTKRGAELEGHYVTLLRELGTRRGMLGQIFTKAQNKTQDLSRLLRPHRHGRRHRLVTLGAESGFIRPPCVHFAPSISRTDTNPQDCRTGIRTIATTGWECYHR